MKSQRFGALALVALLVQGCSSSAARAPSISVFGSFFPAWVICAVGGIVLAVAMRALFIATHIDEHLPAPPLVYLCLSISFGIGLYMLWTGTV